MWINLFEAIFFVGMFVNALLFVPQIIRIWRNQNSESVSLLTCLILWYKLKPRKNQPLDITFETVLDGLPGNIYWIDKNNIILGCNDSQARDLGLKSRHDIVGTSIRRYLANQKPEHLASILENNKRVLQLGEVVETEEMGVNFEGKEIVYFSKKVPLKDKKGNICGLFGVSLDITAQKELERLEQERAEQTKRELELRLKAQEDFNKILCQANHDIASPLAAIDIFFAKYANTIPEQQRINIRNSINTIRGISSSMMLHFKEDDSMDLKQDVLLLPVLLEVLNEKRFEYNDTRINICEDIEKDTYFSFVNLDAWSFKRMISNIINNSVNALSFSQNENPRIVVNLKRTDFNNPDEISITLSDNGPGMPVTSDPKNGHGLGFTQIKQTLDLHGAMLEIESVENIGTKIILTFSTRELPSHFASDIELYPDDIIIVLDDDPSIHGAWDLRFSEIPHVTVKHFTLGQDVVTYLSETSDEERQHLFLLTDYELLNQNLTGIDVINQAKLTRSIMVTGHYLNRDLILRMQENKIRILPKILAANIPIVARLKPLPCS